MRIWIYSLFCQYVDIEKIMVWKDVNAAFLAQGNTGAGFVAEYLLTPMCAFGYVVLMGI